MFRGAGSGPPRGRRGSKLPTGPSERRTSACSRANLLQSSPLPVHALVVGAEFASFDRPPPCFVGSVPLDRASNAFLERDLRTPARLSSQAARIHGVATIVARPIFHVSDQRARPVE